MTIGRGSFLSELVERAGGENLFADVKTSSAPVSIEAVSARDPDLILTTAAGPASFATRPEWRVVRAVRERRFLSVSGSEYDRPGPRSPQARSAPSPPGCEPPAREAGHRSRRAGAGGWFAAARSVGRRGPALAVGGVGRLAPAGRVRVGDRSPAPRASRPAGVPRRRKPLGLWSGAPGDDPQSPRRALPARALGRSGPRCRDRPRVADGGTVGGAGGGVSGRARGGLAGLPIEHRRGPAPRPARPAAVRRGRRLVRRRAHERHHRPLRRPDGAQRVPLAAGRVSAPPHGRRSPSSRSTR